MLQSQKSPSSDRKVIQCPRPLPLRTQVKEEELFFGVVLLNIRPSSIKNTDRQISKDAIERNNCRQVSGDKRSLLDGSLPMLVRHLNRNQRTWKVTWKSYRISLNHSQSKCSYHLAYLSQGNIQGRALGLGHCSQPVTLVMEEATVGADRLWDNRSTGVYYSSVLWKWPTIYPLSPTSCLSLPLGDSFCFLLFILRLPAGYKGRGSRWAWPEPLSNNTHHHGVRLAGPEGEGENTCMYCRLYSFTGDSVWRC